MILRLLLFLTFSGVVSLHAFQSPGAAPAERTDRVVVTGAWMPAPVDELDRPVRSLPVQELRLLSNTYADFLKLDSSVDLRQRAPNVIQGDVSIRGGTFGQTLVLLDGLRLNDVQSGHHSLDVPVPMEMVSAVEVLKGSGSTLYGSDAIGGVVNFVTRKPETSEARLWTALGNFGVNQQRGLLTGVRGKLSQEMSFSRDFSTGFMPNRDYRNLMLGSMTRAETGLGETRVQLGHRDSPFGADRFYGNFNSWERTKTWWAALRQDLGKETNFSLAYRRHTDLFVLYRDRPQVFTNRHAAETFQTSLRRRQSLGSSVTLFYGGEGYRDSIVSNNLGRHDRARGAGYAAVDVRALRRFSFNLGVRDEVYGSGNHQVSPTVSAGAWLAPSLKLRAAVSRAFRLPTFTDLYYHDPANVGSPFLRPETAWSYEGGVDWNAGGRIRAGATVFQRRETDGIDYVRRSPTDIWRATNFQKLRFTGVEADIRIRMAGRQQLDLQYTKLRGAQDLLTGVQSKYVFNYPVHSGLVGWQGSLADFSARTRIGILERFGRDPYAVWDVYGTWARGRLRPFLQLTNLGNTRYQEIPGVAMPGRAVMGGFELILRGPW